MSPFDIVKNREQTSTTASVPFAGHDFVADFSGALYWPAQSTLIVADLHLEKASFFATGGQMLPPYDSAETLAQLLRAVDHFKPKSLIFLGDSFHDPDSGARLSEQDYETLERLADKTNILWIVGNHDPAIPIRLGNGVAETTIAGVRFTHEATMQPGPEVSGHFHPKARLQGRGGRVSGRCFVWNNKRLILPAFGAFTGGLDIRDSAIRSVVGSRPRLLLLGRSRLHLRKPVSPL